MRSKKEAVFHFTQLLVYKLISNKQWNQIIDEIMIYD